MPNIQNFLFKINQCDEMRDVQAFQINFYQTFIKKYGRRKYSKKKKK